MNYDFLNIYLYLWMLSPHGTVGGALSSMFATCYDGTEKQKKIIQRAVPGICLGIYSY